MSSLSSALRTRVLFVFNDVGDSLCVCCAVWVQTIQQYSDLWACNGGGGGGPPEKSNCFMPLWTSCYGSTHHTGSSSQSSSPYLLAPFVYPTNQPVFFLKAANISHESSEPIHLSWAPSYVDSDLALRKSVRREREREPKGYATQPIQPPCVCSVTGVSNFHFLLFV